MDIEKLKKLVRLANSNPNEHEANLAARKVCKVLETVDFKLVDGPEPARQRAQQPAQTWNDIRRSAEPFWRADSNPFADFFDRWKESEKWSEPKKEPKKEEPKKQEPKKKTATEYTESQKQTRPITEEWSKADYTQYDEKPDYHSYEALKDLIDEINEVKAKEAAKKAKSPFEPFQAEVGWTACVDCHKPIKIIVHTLDIPVYRCNECKAKRDARR